MRLPGTHFWEADVPGTEQAQGWGMGAYAMWGASAFTKHSLMADVTPSASSPGLREIYCWQCGTLALRTYSYQTTYTCKVCECSGKLTPDEGRKSFTDPRTTNMFRGVTTVTHERYLDFGDPEVSRMNGSPA